MDKTTLTLTAMTSAALATGAIAQTPSGLSDLVGARAAGAESQLQARGYAHVDTKTGDDRKWSTWWNRDRRLCVTVATYDGRYQAITTAPAADCGHTDKGNGGGDYARDRDRDYRPGYRPDIGYRPPAPVTAAPSYARDDSAMAASDPRFDLGLVCFGDGQRPGLATSYGWTWDSRRDRYQYGNRTELSSEQFDASIMLQLGGGGGRIKLPRKLVPPLHSGGDQGWWPLYDVSVQPDLITATYRLNGLNKPRVTIDRRSGRITILGMAPYAFRGGCDMVDGQDRRRF